MTRSRQLAAIMFTDIEGYTSLMQQNEKNAIQARNKHRKIFNSATEKHKGKVLQYYGDGTLSVFDSAIDAVKCGIEMQLGFQKEPLIPVRIGIHTGDIIFTEEEIIGDSVNIASRLESLAVSGSVFVSDKVYDEIKNQDSIKTSLLKTFKLKNIEKPIEVYAISNVGLIVPNPGDIKDKTEIDPGRLPEKQEQPILATKLYIPPPRSKVVLRPHLIDRMNEGRQCKLILISAPPGFGKTTLTSEWISGSERPAAWLSLDEGDNDPVRFLAYIVAALQTITTNIGKGVLGVLQSNQPPQIESILTVLLNEIASFQDDFTLVLDDYHIINSKQVDNTLTFLLEHLPSQMHLVIISRRDPPLPLARLRVRGQLTELRVKDLRFTSSEAAEFLSQVMGLNLSVENVTALDTQTEGWVAGLQLAALSMQGREDISGFINAFSGDDRYIVDYLVEEVLQSQSDRVRSFLLQTSILKRLSGSLCDSVTDLEEGKELLDVLDSGNLFIIPLDDKRQWYRYHHLFADLLYSRLLEEQPNLISTLHRRASKWYEHKDLTVDAVHHALAAKDYERTADLAELAWSSMQSNSQITTWLGWVRMLPNELVLARPVLSLGYAWSLLNEGDLEAGEARLQDAERWLNISTDTNDHFEAKSSEMVVVDEMEFRFLPATIAAARAYHAGALGDVPGTVKYARRALNLFDGNHFMRAIPTALLGLTYLERGELEPAYQAFADVMAGLQAVGDITAAIGTTTILADIRKAQGRLLEAIRIYEESLQLAKKEGEIVHQGTADLYLGLSELYREQDNLEIARKHLLKTKELSDHATLADWPYCWSLARARIKEAQGDLDGALDLLDQAERLYYRSPMPNIRPVAALKTRMWIVQGKLTKALDWVRDQELSVEDDLNYLREFDHITLARVLISRYKKEREDRFILDAIGLLERLQKAAEEGKREGSLIEILVLLALAQKAKGDIDLGLIPLEHALTIAEPEGYVQIFVDEGIPMAQLLSEAATKGIIPEYIGKLLKSFEAQEQIVKPDQADC